MADWTPLALQPRHALAALAGPGLLLGACAAHVEVAPVRREIALVRCSVFERQTADAVEIAMGSRLGSARFDFRAMSFRLDRMSGRILSIAVASDGRRTAELSGGVNVTFPRRGETGEIVFAEGDRVDRIICGH